MTRSLVEQTQESVVSLPSSIPQRTITNEACASFASAALASESNLGSLPWFVSSPCPDIYRFGNYVCLDWETTNTEFGSALNPSNRIVTGHWCVNGREWKNLNEHGLDALFVDLECCDFVVAHHAKFEQAWLSRLGYSAPILWYDTLLAEYVWSGNRRVPLDLDSVAFKYTGKKKHGQVHELLDQGVCPSTIPLELLDAYCKNDVEITQETFLKQLEIIYDLGLAPSVYSRCLVIPALASMERAGMALDRDAVRGTFEEYNGKLKELRQSLGDHTGGINLNSPKQLGVYLYDTLGFAEPRIRSGEPDRTDAGGRRTDADTVGRLNGTTEQQRRFVELFADYGSLKVNTKALEKMWQCCLDTPSDQVPILYASYNQSVTQTHRLSSSGSKYKLQFHNFNRDFKRLFMARQNDWLVGEGDGAQLEFRVAAHLGRDAAAAADIRDATFDAHYQTSTILLGKSRKDVSKLERQDAKPRTFKPLYGGMSGTAAERKYYKFFQNKYRGIYQTQTAWTHEVANTKQLVTETGLIFYWPDTKVQQDGYITNKTSIFNYPVQSLATADIIPIGLVCCYYRMLSLGTSSFLTNTIHDSIIGEIAPGEEVVFRRLCNHSLTTDTFNYLRDCYSIRFTVPLGCETKVGTHWGTGKEEKFDLDPVDWELIGVSTV